MSESQKISLAVMLMTATGIVMAGAIISTGLGYLYLPESRNMGMMLPPLGIGMVSMLFLVASIMYFRKLQRSVASAAN